MNNSVKVRMTAIVLLALIIASGCFPPALATEQNSSPLQKLGEHTIETNTENDPYFGKIFRIKHPDGGLYLSVKTIDGVPSLITEKTDKASPSQYFRFIPADDGGYLLNSAYEGAAYYAHASLSKENTESRRLPAELEKEETVIEVTATADGSITSFDILENEENGSITLSLSVDGNEELYLSYTDRPVLSSAEENAVGWMLEEVGAKISMAYFETRIRLYSVQKFYVSVSPSAAESFVEWNVDNEEIMLVSQDGTLCALAKGEALLSARLGNTEYSCRVEVCDEDAFTWFSQENVTNSYWNGGALSGIKFYGKPFATNGDWDWMREGCALTSCAMLFRNLGATYTNGYDFRSGQKGDLPADPYTLALANIGHAGFTSPSVNYKKDPVLVRWSSITDAFRVDGRAMSYYQKYTSNLGYIRDALASHPEGVVVRMTKSNGDTHFVLFAECINPSERNVSKLRFIIYDPMSFDGSDGDGVPFEQSASYKSGYRYYNISSVITWKVH